MAFPPNEAVHDRSSFGNIRQNQDKSIDSEVAAASTGGNGDIDHQVIRSELPIDDASDTKVTDRGYGVAAQEGNDPNHLILLLHRLLQNPILLQILWQCFGEFVSLLMLLACCSASEPDVETAATEHLAKKEGFMAKMMEKMPGHHHKAPPHPTDMEVGAHDESGPLEHHASTDSPKKGMMEKIKEKFPGHHTTHAHATDE